MLAAMGPQSGALARLGLAVALSALLHALLLGGVSVRRQAGEQPVTVMLTARLERIEAAQVLRAVHAIASHQGPTMADVLPAYRSPKTMPGAPFDNAQRAARSEEALPAAPGESDSSGKRQSFAESRVWSGTAPQTELQETREALSPGLAPLNSSEAATGNAGPLETIPRSTMPTPSPPLANFDPRPPIEVPVIVDSTVYEARDLDELPVSLSPIEPRFPESAARAGLSGSVTLEVRLDEFGSVRDARVVEAVPVGHFEASALESFHSARFTPAQRDGRAVRCKLVIKVDFTPADRPLAATR